MSSIDDRIVRMKFDNRQFEQGVRQTQKALESLDKKLKMDGATKGLDNISRAAGRFNLGGIGNAVEGISRKFGALSIAGITALTTITNQAVVAGQRMIKSLTLDPVMDGFREYETNMNSVQTILANTAHEGTKLKDVNRALDELNQYSDKTIYNFSEMARNIGTFTAAGVSLDTSTNAIKGIANLAAVSGSNSQQASTAMYQLSQALAAGKVSLMDWNSVVNAGMGGKVFQDALMETARVHGIAIDEMVKTEGGFRNTLQSGWLTSEILTETLSKFTGDLTEAQLKQMGYTQEQIKGILEMGKTAQDAATKIKTFSQLMSTLQEAVGSGWAKTFQILFGDFEEAKELFTDINDALGPIIQKSADARNKLLQGWKDLGGRQALIDALSNAFEALMGFLKPIGEAFRDIFPPTTAQQLMIMTVALKNFTAGLKMGAETSAKVKRVFTGIFAALDIGRMILVEAVRMFLKLFGVAAEGSGAILDSAASFGDYVKAVRDALKASGGIRKFFETLGDILAVPIRLVKVLAGFIGSLFTGFDAGGVTEAFSGLSDVFGPLTDGVSKFASKFSWLGDILGAGGAIVGKVARVLGNFASTVLTALGESFTNMDSETIYAGLNTALLGGIALVLKKLFDFIKNFDLDLGSNLFGNLSETIGDAVDSLTGAFTTMQNNLKANTLLQLAAAIALITGSIVALSGIKVEDLQKSMVTITGVFAQLGGALFALGFIANGPMVLKLPIIASGLVILAGAIRIMAGAVKTMSDLSWGEMLRGLAGLAGVLGIMIGALKLMSGLGKRLIPTASGLVVLAVAIKLLASAVKDFSSLDWGQLAKGLLGVGSVLVGLALFTKFAAVNKGGLAQGAGLLLLAGAVKVLASAVEDFASMNVGELVKGIGAMSLVLTALSAFSKSAGGGPGLLLTAAALGIVSGAIVVLAGAVKAFGSMDIGSLVKGLIGMGSALAIIGVALTMIPPTTFVTAASLVAVSVALNLVAAAMAVMGEMSWEEIAKSMVMLAGSLTILGVALYAMSGTLPGAAALIVAAGALALMVPPLLALGSMSWEAIGKGLAALAGSLAIVAAAGYLLTGAIPGLLGLGAAALLIGGAALTAGIGVEAFAKGLKILAGIGASAIDSIVKVIRGLLKVVPEIATTVAKGFVKFIEVIASNTPKITNAFVKIMGGILSAIIRTSPMIVETFLRMILMLLTKAAAYIPRFVNAGTNLLVGMLNGLAGNLGRVITAATNVIVAFLNGITRNLGRITDAGVKLVIAAVNGVANGIRNNQGAMNSAGRNLGSAIITGMTSGIFGGLSGVVSAARQVASRALSAAKSALGIHSPSKKFAELGKYSAQGFANGLRGGYKEIKTTLEAMFKLTADTRKSTAADMKNANAAVNKARRSGNRSAIRKAQSAYNQARAEHIKANTAHYYLLNNLSKQRDQLLTLGRTYDWYTNKLAVANKAYADAIKTRDDYHAQVRDQYDKMPGINNETTYESYKAELEKQISDTITFNRMIQELRKRGLSDEMYKELLTQGTAALPFMQGVLDRGKAGVDEVNKLSKKLASEAAGLGATASKALYQAAVDSTRGIIVGLEKNQAAIAKQMDKIATSMVNAIKKKLGIRSPSREFMEVGRQINAGLNKGLVDYSGQTIATSSKIGANALDAMRKSITDVGALVTEQMDTTPVISPVIDLTNVEKSVAKIDSLMGLQKLEVDTSYSSAIAASNAIQTTRQDAMPNTGAEVHDTLQFVQNNYSPKALTPIEIYRQTSNQLSVAKGALTLYAD